MRDVYLEVLSPLSTLPAGVLLVSLYPATTPPDGVEMLRRVAGACGLDPAAQAAFFPLPDGGTAAATSLRDAAAAPGAPPLRFVAAYGLTPRQIGAAWLAQRYAWVDDGAVAYCFAERPEVVNDDLARKKALWGCLRRVKEAVGS